MIGKLKHFENYIFLLILTAANYWVWQLFSNNLDLGIILLVIELGLFILITKKNLKKVYTITLSVSVLLLLTISAFLLRGEFDQTLLTISPTETSILNQRHGYLIEGLGKIFPNKYIPYYKLQEYDMATGKYLQNIFYSLDPNLYFFRSHPREKAGIDEYNKYSPIVLPLFIAGVLFLTIYYRKYKFLILYSLLAILFTGFISPKYKLGPILMFPPVNIILYLGLIAVILKVKPLFKK